MKHPNPNKQIKNRLATIKGRDYDLRIITAFAKTSYVVMPIVTIIYGLAILSMVFLLPIALILDL